MMGLLRKFALIGVLVLAVPATAGAQAVEGAADDGRLQSMIDELKDMLDKAEKQRLADPWFIRDMREVIQRYDWPWNETIYDESFSVASRRPPEPWNVHSGRFRVDGSLGLRSVFYPQVSEAADTGTSQPSSTGETVGQLLGQIIKKSLNEDSGGGAQQEAEAEPDIEAAVATLSVGIANAFALRTIITTRPLDTQGNQTLAFGPFQGEGAVAGYRLVYQPDAADGALSLIKRSSRGTVSTIEFADSAVDLSDGSEHEILWTRDRRGRMQIGIDGRTVMDVIDRGFSDPFAGLVIRNEGGDYAFDRIVIQAMP